MNYTESGGEIVKGILTKGDLFGEMAVLGEKKRSDFKRKLIEIPDLSRLK